MTVYVVTIGEYSDRYIYGITMNKEKAYNYVERYNKWSKWQDAAVQEHELDDFRDDRFGFCVSVFNNGETRVRTTDEKDEAEGGYMPFNEVFPTYDDVWAYVENRPYQINRIYGLGVYVHAEDDEHAKKTAYDLIAKHKAKEAGL